MKKDQIKLPINTILIKIFNVCEKKRIQSVLLIGSAARNELTTIMDENGFFVSDIEIIVLLKPSFLFKKKNQKINLFIGNYKVEILFTYLLFLKNLRTPLVYDLKTTSKVLWGMDVRNSIWIKKSKNIPYWEGIRLLYNRLIPFEILIWKYLKNLPIKKIDEYNSTKLLIAIGEFLMIQDKNYVVPYKEKLQYLNNKLKKNTISKELINALEYKLNIFPNYNNLNSIKTTGTIAYIILKKINPILNSFKVPISIKIIDIIKKAREGQIKKIFLGLDVIHIYNRAYQLLDDYINNYEKFIRSGREIKSLYTDWKNCMQIQSSYL